MLKALEVNVASFAGDVGEQVETVLAYLKKGELEQAVRDRLSGKCKKWVL